MGQHVVQYQGFLEMHRRLVVMPLVVHPSIVCKGRGPLLQAFWRCNSGWWVVVNTTCAHSQLNEISSCAGFLEVHRRLVSGPIDSELSGSTAVACLLSGTRLTTAWAGDSRAVLARTDPDIILKGFPRLVAQPLTRDHEPSLEAERRRIVAAGGRVERCTSPAAAPVVAQRLRHPAVHVGITEEGDASYTRSCLLLLEAP